MASEYDAIVIGGGLAGLSAAFEFTERGLRPLVLEAAEQLGGRTSNWQENGMDVESGIHKFVGFYKEFPALLERAGLDLDKVFIYHDEIEISVAEGGDRNADPKQRHRSGRFGTSVFFRPLKTIGGALGNSEVLSWKDKFQLVKFLAVGTAAFLSDPASLDKLSVAEYAKKHGVSDNVINTVIWSLSAGLFFLPPERYSAYPFFALSWAGTKRSYKSRVAIFRGGMTDVMAAPLGKAIEKRGGGIRLGTAATSLVTDQGRVIGVRAGRETIDSSNVVLATQIAPAKKIVTASSGLPEDTQLKKLVDLPDMSGIAVQIELDKPARKEDHITFGANSILGTFGEQSHSTFKSSKGRISTFLTPVEPFIHMSDEKIVEAVIEDLARQGIDVRGRVTNSAVVRHPSEFYLLEPGSEALRPKQKTGIGGLALAGDYTKQDYICSMEGAVISGRLAVESLAEAGGK